MSPKTNYNRIHASFDEATLAQIDQEAEKQGVSRGKWLADAVGSYLSLLGLCITPALRKLGASM